MICNCTLMGTDACKQCSNNHYNDQNYTQINCTKLPVQPMAYPVVQYWCSKCEALLNKYDKFCHNCGLAINWDDVKDD